MPYPFRDHDQDHLPEHDRIYEQLPPVTNPTGDLFLADDGTYKVPPSTVGIPESEKAAANGVATLDSSGLLPETQVPTRLQDASLKAAYAPVVASPRAASRVLLERRPVLSIDRQYPNAYIDHKLVYVDDTIMYGVGHDLSLRSSSDGGVSWGAPLSNSGGLGYWAKSGMFLKTAAGSLLTTYHPFDLSAPKIQRSTDGGKTWTDVVAAQTNVDYLGVNSIAQDPVSGYLYLTEYVTVSAATQATFKISRSTDDGATWTAFHTFQRDATANPTTAVRHGHSIQWDPIEQRMWFLCGDSEAAAGQYRVNAAGTDIEPVITNAQLNQSLGEYAGAVGVMFFPDYIAWGVDQVSTSTLLRMNRNQIGASNPVVVQGPQVQTTCFYTVQTMSDSSEWLMTTSNEDGGGGRLDNGMHIYRVADDGATVDEIASIPTNSPTNFSWIYPLSTPLQSSTTGLFWLGSTVSSQSDFDPGMHGFQFSCRIVWGVASAPRPEQTKKPFYQPITANSGLVSLAAKGQSVFGVTTVPTRLTRLYILEVTREQTAGTGFPYVEVYDVTGAAILKMEDGVTLMQWQHNSERATQNQPSAPYLWRSAPLQPGRKIYFRLDEVLNNTATALASVTYAWGF